MLTMEKTSNNCYLRIACANYTMKKKTDTISYSTNTYLDRCYHVSFEKKNKRKAELSIKI